MYTLHTSVQKWRFTKEISAIGEYSDLCGRLHLLAL